MTFEEFAKIFDESILPDIKEISEKIIFVKAKDKLLCCREIYDAYKKLNDLYKKQVFNKTEEVLLDRHKVASCICGAFLKVCVFDFSKSELIKYLKENGRAVEAYVFYANELIALRAATKFLSFFMVSEKVKAGDYEAARKIIENFPLPLRTSNCKLGFWSITLYNLSQIRVDEPENSARYSIGIEHYDMYAYSMYFYWLELYFNMIQDKEK